MCRSTDYHGFQSYKNDRLRITDFSVRFSCFNAGKLLPESLTLLYLPSFNGDSLEIDGLKVKPSLNAFVTLHRVVAMKTKEREVMFESRERVKVSEGVRFEIYLEEEKVLKGIFTKDEDDEWRLECGSGIENAIGVEVAVAEAEICVAAEGKVAMSEKVDMVVKRKRKNRGVKRLELEAIPELRELNSTESDDCCCCCSDELDGQDLVDGKPAEMEVEMAAELEGVKWAVDVGIWVMCLGLGFMISRKSLRRIRIL